MDYEPSERSDFALSEIQPSIFPDHSCALHPTWSRVPSTMFRCLSIAPVTTLAFCGAIVGCGKTGESKSHVAPAASVSSSARQETAPPPQNPRDFGAMFQNEADNRPTGTIKAEDAIAAFRRDGIELNTVRQHLGRPYGARYCVGAMSGTDVAVSVCEYIDAQAAQAGSEMSRKIVLANREIKVKQATSLTVREIEKSPAADAMSKRLFDAFAKL